MSGETQQLHFRFRPRLEILCAAFSVVETFPEHDPWDLLVVSTRDREMQRAGGV